jgi:tetratricopeptide (TPR) repeat protein
VGENAALPDMPTAIETSITSEGIVADAEMSKNLATVESLVKQLMHFIHIQRSRSAPDEPNAENNNRVLINMGHVVASARSIISQIDDADVASQSDAPLSEPELEDEGQSPAATYTVATSITDRIHLPPSDDPEPDIELEIIERLRETASALLQQNRYAEAKAHFLRVQTRSETKYGNEYEWKDHTIKSIAIIDCRLHKWSDVDDALTRRFQGRDEVLRSLTLEYFVDGRLDEAVRVLSAEEEFDQRDETIRRIAEDLCRQKKWAEAVKFTQLKFAGREGPLEVVAAGFQQTGMWTKALSVLKDLLDLQMLRNPESSIETVHSIANSYLNQGDCMSAADWCRDAQQLRLRTVGRQHLLFYHTLNLHARIARHHGDLEEADSQRLLLPPNIRDGMFPRPALILI